MQNVTFTMQTGDVNRVTEGDPVGTENKSIGDRLKSESRSFESHTLHNRRVDEGNNSIENTSQSHKMIGFLHWERSHSKPGLTQMDENSSGTQHERNVLSSPTAPPSRPILTHEQCEERPSCCVQFALCLKAVVFLFLYNWNSSAHIDNRI